MEGNVNKLKAVCLAERFSPTSSKKFSMTSTEERVRVSETTAATDSDLFTPNRCSLETPRKRTGTTVSLIETNIDKTCPYVRRN